MKETYICRFTFLQDNGYWTSKSEEIEIDVVREKCNHKEALTALQEKYSGKELYVNSVLYV